MLTYIRTSALESNAQTAVNTVNCVGVMGKGIAAEYKARHPDMYKAYRAICERGELSPGKLWLWKGAEQWILNFPTKVHWRHPSKLEWVEDGLKKFVAEFEARGITEISFPRLGCGHGNLDWKDVKPLMERYLSNLPINVYVHDFSVDIGIPEHLQSATKAISKASAFDASFERFSDSLRGIVTLVGGDLVDLCTGEPFKAKYNDEELQLLAGNDDITFESEDVRAMWLTLMRGYLTPEKMGWPNGAPSTRIMSLVSLLPCARPVQIQKAKSEQAELAVELRRSPTGASPTQASEQLNLAWH